MRMVRPLSQRYFLYGVVFVLCLALALLVWQGVLLRFGMMYLCAVTFVYLGLNVKSLSESWTSFYSKIYIQVKHQKNTDDQMGQNSFVVKDEGVNDEGVKDDFVYYTPVQSRRYDESPESESESDNDHAMPSSLQSAMISGYKSYVSSSIFFSSPLDNTVLRDFLVGALWRVMPCLEHSTAASDDLTVSQIAMRDFLSGAIDIDVVILDQHGKYLGPTDNNPPCDVTWSDVLRSYVEMISSNLTDSMHDAFEVKDEDIIDLDQSKRGVGLMLSTFVILHHLYEKCGWSQELAELKKVFSERHADVELLLGYRPAFYVPSVADFHVNSGQSLAASKSASVTTQIIAMLRNVLTSQSQSLYNHLESFVPDDISLWTDTPEKSGDDLLIPVTWRSVLLANYIKVDQESREENGLNTGELTDCTVALCQLMTRLFRDSEMTSDAEKLSSLVGHHVEMQRGIQMDGKPVKIYVDSTVSDSSWPTRSRLKGLLKEMKNDVLQIVGDVSDHKNSFFKHVVNFRVHGQDPSTMLTAPREQFIRRNVTALVSNSHGEAQYNAIVSILYVLNTYYYEYSDEKENYLTPQILDMVLSLELYYYPGLGEAILSACAPNSSFLCCSLVVIKPFEDTDKMSYHQSSQLEGSADERLDEGSSVADDSSDEESSVWRDSRPPSR